MGSPAPRGGLQTLGKGGRIETLAGWAWRTERGGASGAGNLSFEGLPMPSLARGIATSRDPLSLLCPTEAAVVPRAQATPMPAREATEPTSRVSVLSGASVLERGRRDAPEDKKGRALLLPRTGQLTVLQLFLSIRVGRARAHTLLSNLRRCPQWIPAPANPVSSCFFLPYVPRTSLDALQEPVT